MMPGNFATEALNLSAVFGPADTRRSRSQMLLAHNLPPSGKNGPAPAEL